VAVTCGRFGTTRNWRKLEDWQRQRMRSTNKCGCQFKLWFLQEDLNDESSFWTILYYHDAKYGLHNHDAFDREKEAGLRARNWVAPSRGLRVK
jgi:hypothetical protein